MSTAGNLPPPACPACATAARELWLADARYLLTGLRDLAARAPLAGWSPSDAERVRVAAVNLALLCSAAGPHAQPDSGQRDIQYDDYDGRNPGDPLP